MLRLSKIACVSAIAFYSLLIVWGNITDYCANFPVMVNVLSMKEISSHSLIGYRAIITPWLHHTAFLIILVFESLTAIFCAYGAWQLFKNRQANVQIFNQSKSWSIVGLTCGFLTWQVLFLSIGGEWFGLWMSPTLRGTLTTSFQITMTFLGVLIYLALKDE